MVTLPEGFRQGITLLAYGLALMWGLALVDLLFAHRGLTHLGIQPRRLVGLPGIVVAPLLHQNLPHLLANSAPLVILGSLVLLRGLTALALVTALAWLGSGLGSWLLGRAGTCHLGASGLVFGYLGFLLLRGYFDRTLPSLAISLVVGFLYGGSLWGLLPLQRGKSWVGHGSGFLAGALGAHQLELWQSWGLGGR
jgi:membrane associated rhomboid family serine protease